MKNKLTIIFALLIIAFFILFWMNWSGKQLNKYKNGFTRNFLKEKSVKLFTAGFENHFTGLCGSTADHLFFSDEKPGRITMCTYSMTTLNRIDLQIPDYPDLRPVFYTFVDSPTVNILAGNLHAALKGRLHDSEINKINLPISNFSNAISVDRNIVIFRSMDRTIPESFFYKYDLTRQSLIKEKDLTEKNHDGGYSYDGNLNYDPLSGRFIYVCAYCNHLTCFDTSLNLLYRAKTLDTCNIPKVKISVTKTSIAHASPPVTINLASCVYGNYLFVLSALKADNEEDDLFDTHFVIDIYSIKTGTYKGSFYIPVLSGEKLLSFNVIRNNILIALYDNHIVSYHLPTIPAGSRG